MSLEANKEIVRRMFEEDLNTDDRDAAYRFSPRILSIIPTRRI
jgi:hypothetical protein